MTTLRIWNEWHGWRRWRPDLFFAPRQFGASTYQLTKPEAFPP